MPGEDGQVMEGESTGRRRKRDLEEFVRFWSHVHTDAIIIAYYLSSAPYVAMASDVPQANEAPVTWHHAALRDDQRCSPGPCEFHRQDAGVYWYKNQSNTSKVST